MVDPVTGGLIGWACGKLGDKVLNRLVSDRKLVKDVDKALMQWAKSLGADRSVDVGALLPEVSPAHATEERPMYCALQASLTRNQLSPKEVWHAVFMESWRWAKTNADKKEDLQGFFTLKESEASEALDTLARQVHAVCIRYKPIFESAVIDKLDDLLQGQDDICQYLRMILRVVTPIEEGQTETPEHKAGVEAERSYRGMLKRELGKIRMLGSPDVPNVPVGLLETFVHLDISMSWRCEERDFKDDVLRQGDLKEDFSPDAVVEQAFAQSRTLLLVGDPGSGKTTLMKYYAMSCLTREDYQKLGFEEPRLPLYFPLRETAFNDDGKPIPLAGNLRRWVDSFELDIPEDQFKRWLRERPTLLLLDGLDEISDVDKRRQVCSWIDKLAAGLGNALFVVTTRSTGYRKSDCIELGQDHLRADVRDFSEGQQKEFITNWFNAAFSKEPLRRGQAVDTWQDNQKQKAARQARQVIDYLALPENKAIRQLAAVPLLLQIIAVIWKERGFRPKTRVDLFSAVMRYLLEYRDSKRGLDPVLSAEEALRVLRPVALWMQEELRADDVRKDKAHARMTGKINAIDPKISAEAFCANIRDRAGIIADYGTTAYIFRHKSFREYLAGMEIAKGNLNPDRFNRLAGYLGNAWWEETLRFFLSHVDEDQFDGFMKAVFEGPASGDLDMNTQRLLRTMVAEACERKTDSLAVCLAGPDGQGDPSRKQCILDCLKIIDSADAWEAIQAHAHADAAAAEYARELVAQHAGEELPPKEVVVPKPVFTWGDRSFRNPFELNAEYILIPGGQSRYHVTSKTESVPDLYFAKYPVTNKRYRRFIRYLVGEDRELAKVLSPYQFYERVLNSPTQIPGFGDYLGSDRSARAEKLRSGRDEDRRFGSDDQPVVSVSWFAARAYCAWLTMLARVSGGQPAGLYRLPEEVQWVWAASGGAREYPWSPEKGEPTDKLANYKQNVGATTPIGSYPDGGTPGGVMDMAGNVWEWMDSWDEDYSGQYRWLRGGSWISYAPDLRCSARVRSHLVYCSCNLGFRVVFSQS